MSTEIAEISRSGHSRSLSLTDGSLTVQEMQSQIALIQHHMSKNMKDGEHYGIIPGCGKKPTLLKPGAEKLCFIFQLAPQFTTEVLPLERGHREYRTKCTLIHRPTGLMVAEGEGSCATLEGKYRYRDAERTCPECGKAAIIKGKAEYGGGFVCFKKKDGCGAKFSDDAPEIVNQPSGKVEHDNPADYYNTCLKMSAKRAIVAATLFGTAASDIFTQDVEDMPEVIPAVAAVQRPPLRNDQGGVRPAVVEPEPYTLPDNPWTHELQGKSQYKDQPLFLVEEAVFRQLIVPSTLERFSKQGKLTPQDVAAIMAANADWSGRFSASEAYYGSSETYGEEPAGDE